jgi:hypothetical protein
VKKRTLRALLAPLAGLVLLAPTAAVALGAATSTATTQPATSVTATSATLNGTVQAAHGTTSWQFQFGKTLPYDKATPVQTITGTGGKAVAVHWPLRSLAPSTTYHYRLVVITGKGSSSPQTSNGADLTFTTKSAGKLLLTSSLLRVSGNMVGSPLDCASQLPCNGRLTINTRAKLATGKVSTILCTTTFFRINHGARATVKSRVRAGCLSLLKKARTHTIRAKFTSRPRTGQLGLIKAVTLVLK